MINKTANQTKIATSKPNIHTIKHTNNINCPLDGSEASIHTIRHTNKINRLEDLRSLIPQHNYN